MSHFISRRRMLQALAVGAGSLASGLGRRSSSRKAYGASPQIPRRLIIYPIMNGGGADSAADASWAVPGSSPTNFTLGPILKPFADAGLADQLVLIKNLEFYRRPGVTNDEQHWAGNAQMLTGVTPEGYSGKGVSIDQYLAGKIGAGLPWGSLYMSTCNKNTISYLADGTQVGANKDPLDVYKKVFGNLSTTGPDPSLLRRLARRKSVLDGVAKDLNGFVAQLPAEDRARAESQLAAIQSLETQLANQMQGGSQCKSPTIGTGVDYSRDYNMPATMRAFIDLTVAALACDQTRVVLMNTYLSDDNDSMCGWDPVNQPGWSHHGLSHYLDSTNGAAWLAARQFHHQLMAELAGKLKAIPEGDGTMLDHTLILIPSEVGLTWSHSPFSLAWTTIGGKGLGVKTGQYLKVAPDAASYDDPGKGLPVQRMLVSVLKAMGLTDDTFNDEPSINTGSGPISGFLA